MDELEIVIPGRARRVRSGRGLDRELIRRTAERYCGRWYWADEILEQMGSAYRGKRRLSGAIHGTLLAMGYRVSCHYGRFVGRDEPTLRVRIYRPER